MKTATMLLDLFTQRELAVIEKGQYGTGQLTFIERWPYRQDWNQFLFTMGKHLGLSKNHSTENMNNERST